MEGTMGKQHVVLVGAGHAHVQVLEAFAESPPDCRLTLVVDTPIAVYSGMVPGFVAGQYRSEELEVPLGRFTLVRDPRSRDGADAGACSAAELEGVIGFLHTGDAVVTINALACLTCGRRGDGPYDSPDGLLAVVSALRRYEGGVPDDR